MRMLYSSTSAFLLAFATSALAGIPTVNTLTCPVGGKTFTTTGTASCTTFGGSQDFLLKVQTSCDFVTRLPRCPDNGLPMYKDFSPKEIALLESYLKSAEYLALAGRSRFLTARKIDEHLVRSGSVPVFDFWYLLGGLQHDRAATLTDPDYLQLLKAAGRVDLAKAESKDAPIIRLVLAYASYVTGDFASAKTDLAGVEADDSVKDNKFVQTYARRLAACIKAEDVKLCPANDQVMPKPQ
jgi:hypothetical protein